MQLNTLTLNSNITSTQSNLKLKIYDHKLINLHQDIFIFGKKIQKNQTETCLLKLNLNSFDLKPVFNLNAPSFTQFTLFSFQGFLYFYGKTDKLNQIQPKNQLYQFDGFKFTLLEQYGQYNDNATIYSSCIFNNKFLLIFGYLPSNSSKIQCNFVQSESNQIKSDCYCNKSQWYILDLQQIILKPVYCHQSLPFCEKAQLLWFNGRGYLFLKQAYDSQCKIYQKNKLYEIKFQFFSQLILKCDQIGFSQEILQQQCIFEHFFTFDDENLLIMSGQQIISSHNLKQFQLHQKKIYRLHLQTFQWEKQPQIIQMKGYDGEIICLKNRLIHVGGIYKKQITQNIQIIHYDTNVKKFIHKINFNSFKYQQSRCYNCQQAFTYEQKFIYAPLVRKDHDFFFQKKKIEIKFFRKLSKQFASEFQAIGLLIDFMKYLQCQQISIKLCEKFSQRKQFWFLKKKIDQEINYMLCIEAKSSYLIPLQIFEQSFNNQDQQNPTKQLSDFTIQMTKLKIATLNIGRGLLFVTLTQQNKILVGYSSCSSIEFTQTNLKSFSIIYYTINFKNQSQKIQYSSIKNRHIIYENVKFYFEDLENYQKVGYFKKLSQKKYNKLFPWFVYVLEVTNLEKTLKTQEFLNKNYEDIRIKDRKSKNPLNSLQKYLRHLYLDSLPKIFLESSPTPLKCVYQIFEDFEKNNFIKLLPIKDEKNSKTELQQTHFTTNQDDSQEKKVEFFDKGSEIAEKFMIYFIDKKNTNEFDQYYQSLFIYHSGRLVRIISTLNNILCGVIQLNKSIQILLNNTNLSSKRQQKKLKRWLQNIELSIFNENHDISEV